MAHPDTTGVQRVRAGDLDVTYRFDGPRDAPVVMLMHGVLTDHRMWDALADRLAGRYAVLRHDIRGHGGTTATAAPYTMAQLAGDAVALLDALCIKRAHFIGSSLGGMVGQQMGAHHPDRLLSLTLANTTAVQGAAAAWQQRIVSARQEGVASLASGTLQRWFTSGYFERAPDEVARLRRLLLGTSVEGFAGCADAISRLSQLHLLADIHVPTLVIVGAEDQATPPTQGAQVQARVLGARLVVIEDAAHQSAVEQPGAFCEAWLEFVSQAAPSSASLH
jgi:3-oxoadipate enol-lactonase